jgi:hypothetical protein
MADGDGCQKQLAWRGRYRIVKRHTKVISGNPVATYGRTADLWHGRGADDSFRYAKPLARLYDEGESRRG